jgi:hypothetical protein
MMQCLPITVTGLMQHPAMTTVPSPMRTFLPMEAVGCTAVMNRKPGIVSWICLDILERVQLWPTAMIPCLTPNRRTCQIVTIGLNNLLVPVGVVNHFDLVALAFRIDNYLACPPAPKTTIPSIFLQTG